MFADYPLWIAHHAVSSQTDSFRRVKLTYVFPIAALSTRAWVKRSRENERGSIPLTQARSYGIPTGIGADICNRIEGRKSRVAAAERELKVYEIEMEAAPALNRAATSSNPATTSPAPALP